MMTTPVNISPPAADVQPAGVSLRRMRMDDIEQAHAIDRISFTVPWPANSFRYELEENHTSLLWVAETGLPRGGRQVVGTIVVWMILDEAHIATLAVLPEYRGRGISNQLLNVALLDAIDHGAFSATLEVRAGNLVAQSLYQKFQFDIVGIRPHYYRDNNEDALIMTVANLNGDYRTWLQRRGWET